MAFPSAVILLYLYYYIIVLLYCVFVLCVIVLYCVIIFVFVRDCYRGRTVAKRMRCMVLFLDTSLPEVLQFAFCVIFILHSLVGLAFE